MRVSKDFAPYVETLRAIIHAGFKRILRKLFSINEEEGMVEVIDLDDEWDVNECIGSVMIDLDVRVNRGISSRVQKLFSTYRKEIGVIVVNLLAKRDRRICYSRNTHGKMKDKRYNPKQITNYGIINAVNALEEKGYIINTIAERQYGVGAKKIPSSFIATPLFYDIFDTDTNTQHSKTTIVEDIQRVVLKDKEKRMVGYRDNDLTRYTRDCLRYYNSYISSKKVEYTDANGVVNEARCTLTRIFNVEVGNTGRLYHSELQNIHSEYRESVLINEMTTLEIDFSSLHLQMLIDMYYKRSTVSTLGDLYLLPLTENEQAVGANRSAVKHAFNIMLNCTTKNSACAAVQQYLNTEGIWSTFRSGKKIVERIEEAYSFLPLNVILWQSVPMAYVLQRKDSDIAMDLICCGVEQDIPVLPIHDSFITTIENKLWLQESMKHFYCKYINNVPTLNVSVNVLGEISKEII